MFSHHKNAGKPNHPAENEESHRQIEHEIKELIHRLTSKMADLHFHSKSHHPSQLHHRDGHDDDLGLKVIVLTGKNSGASMKAGEDEITGIHAAFPGQCDVIGAYANSNFQAVNNSVVLGGSCTANDPGVHLDIPIETGEPEYQYKEYKKMKRKKKMPVASDSSSTEDDDENKKKQEKKSSSSESSSSSSEGEAENKKKQVKKSSSSESSSSSSEGETENKKKQEKKSSSSKSSS